MVATRFIVLSGLLLASASQLAFAHPGHVGHDHALAQGVLHPLTGLDHLLAMLGVGLWAAQMGRRNFWALPLAFIGFMLVGGLLGVAALPLPYVESGIAASVLLIGLASASALRLNLGVGVFLVGLFALLHGQAHGTELASSVARVPYFVGFVVATALLHMAGIVAGLGVRSTRLQPVLRLGGGGIAAVGLLMLIGLV